MTLSHVLDHLDSLDLLVEIRNAARGGRTVSVEDLPDATRPLLAAATIDGTEGNVIVVTSQMDRAYYIASIISEYTDPEDSVEIWPAPDAHPYDQLADDPEVRIRRLSILDDLCNGQGRTILVAPVTGLMQRLISPAELTASTRFLAPGDQINLPELQRWLGRIGYRRSPMVQEPGEYAVRGGIIDIFPPSMEAPVRLDLFDTDLESIRTFDVHNQRSRDRLPSLTILPTLDLPLWNLKDAFPTLRDLSTSSLRDEVRDDWEHQLAVIGSGGIPTSPDLFAGYITGQEDTLLRYLDSESVIVVDQPEAVDLAASQWEQQATDLEASLIRNGEMPAGMVVPVSPWQMVRADLRRHPRLLLGESREGTTLRATAFGNPPVYAGRLDEMAADLQERLDAGWRITIATDQVERVSELLEERGIYPRRSRKSRSSKPASLLPGTIEVQPSGVDAGWMWDEGKYGVWTDLELFGFRKRARRTSKRSIAEHRAFALNLVEGEHVVHIDHGIARFEGLTRMETGGVEREYLLLVFDRGDKLYVPIDQSDRVTRYSGGGQSPTLNRLGSGEWVRAKRRVRRAVREMAFELIQLYARREAGSGYAFPPDTKWDIELAESFPWKETRDQASAIEAVTADMEDSNPMDRLVCGDVGFGKTEVAMRAAFKAVNAGKQVAVLVPTTVLALQHYNTFRERLAAFPVRVEMLSRLRSHRQQRETLKDLEAGKVDILIGTHRLVQNDVRFKDLGLVVIDEEQRFGVRHKEFLKQMRIDTDVLTLSATPIPRTLHLSLAGIRDISMIETAPQSRLPIRTFVAPFSDQLVREAIHREMDRGGQIYIIHNRVHDIDVLAERIRRIVPEARIGVGHGQMDERVLEEVMLGFYRKEFDILLATTIIESGVDNPDVNTIIIDNADTLGLTQLYQLRGRVGRSSNRAYAYLLYQPHKALRAEARERLEVIQEANELGAGIRVAMRDLEIRGAGNILGAEQSGHIGAVGYDLYMRLLSQAIDEIRSGKPVVETGPITLDLPLTALIPEDYVPDTELRLQLYRRIASVESLTEVGELRDELADRFGDPPVEIEHLLALIRLRLRAAALGLDSMVEREREIILRPIETSSLDITRLERRLGDAVKVTRNTIRLRLMRLGNTWQEALDYVLDELESSTLARTA
ncbi:MAG TPA: transcription-repair coupling factor [Thermomicrobiales bacterium]|nr:transcription-repair coupling factor [Thermomicrobiales bacterium]